MANPRAPLILAAVAAVLLLLQIGRGTVDQHRASEQAAALLQRTREDTSDADALLVASRPPGARALLAGEDLGTTPLLLRKARFQPGARLELARPGYRAELVLPAQWSHLDLALRNPIALQPTLPGLSQVLAHPFGAAGALAALAALALHLRRPRASAFPDPGDFVGPGGRIGGYALDREVGRGSMAEVYLGRSLGDGATVAVKVLHPEVGENEEFRRRFHREVAICRTMQHPGILRVHDMGEGWGRLFLAMDHVPGPSLREVIPPGGMDPERARELVRALAEALAYAHGQGIVHRDLKPENVLLAADGRPLLADFGMARGERYETLTASDATLGTPAYMPPEQVTGIRSDRRADLYSLGCVFYELLTGTPPFQGEAMAVIMHHLSDDPEPPSHRRPGIPPAMEAVILKLLQKEPDDRYPDAETLLRDL